MASFNRIFPNQNKFYILFNANLLEISKQNFVRKKKKQTDTKEKVEVKFKMTVNE